MKLAAAKNPDLSKQPFTLSIHVYYIPLEIILYNVAPKNWQYSINIYMYIFSAYNNNHVIQLFVNAVDSQNVL